MVYKIIPSIVYKETLQWRSQKFTLFKLGLWYLFQLLGFWFTVAIYYTIILSQISDVDTLQIYQRVLYYFGALFAVMLQSGILFYIISFCYVTTYRILQYLPYLIFLINGILPLALFAYKGILLQLQDPTWKSDPNQTFIGHLAGYLTLSTLISLSIVYVQIQNEERERTERKMPILSKRTLKSFFDELNEKKRLKKLKKEQSIRNVKVATKRNNHKSAGSSQKV
ncbi:hypothetical protein FGO68_gene16755 [Halteria grandinella]|uniref:Transmembrane protein n=1 Tax=Halteria grandinella TaxID=5974 RepID=A0A8J8NQU1_HALGN|nr:hypothetical protein FGO68_gene16755 [Halteria grandinella]